MKKLSYPLAPLAVALAFGNMTERALLQSPIMGDGSITIFFTRPISAVVMSFALFLFLLPAIRIVMDRARVALANRRREEERGWLE